MGKGQQYYNASHYVLFFLSLLKIISLRISFLPISDVDGVLSRANDTEFGLASGVFTRDINKAMYVSERLEAGTVFINTYNKTDVAAPFGGFKQSGFGKDLGKREQNTVALKAMITLVYWLIRSKVDKEGT